MNQTHNNVVIILAKKPDIGRVKTRIAKDTSNSFAYKVSVSSLEDLLNNLNNSNYFDLVVGTDTAEDLEWYERTYNIGGITINIPTEANLSERMKYVFSNLTGEYGYHKVILIPMDMPFIQSEEIISAFSRLDNFSYVLGPETNGGIFLIGMTNKTYKAKMFNNVAWSTAHSFENLLQNFGRRETYRLKLKEDINTFPDLLANRDQIKLYCPKLYELLHQEGYYIEHGNRFVDFDTINIPLPVVSAIVERENKGTAEILLQTRNKPTTDPVYSGRLEIPSGLINRYEDASSAVIREVKEETGLNVTLNISKNPKEYFHGDKNDSVLSYEPFCVTQQIKGGRSYLSLSFICQLENQDGSLTENKYETINPNWVSLKKVRKMLADKPDSFFILNIPVLKKYLDLKKNNG